MVRSCCFKIPSDHLCLLIGCLCHLNLLWLLTAVLSQSVFERYYTISCNVWAPYNTVAFPHSWSLRRYCHTFCLCMCYRPHNVSLPLFLLTVPLPISLTRSWTWAPSNGSVESWPLDSQKSPSVTFFFFFFGSVTVWAFLWLQRVEASPWFRGAGSSLRSEGSRAQAQFCA